MADLITMAGLTLLVMLSPGPDLVLVLRNTVAAGRRAGAWTAAGILCGNLVHISYCLLGIGWLLANSIVAFTVLKVAGGVYLIFLGVQSLKPQSADMPGKPAGPTAPGACWAQGLLNNLLNPKGALFYLGVFAALIQPAEDSPAFVAALALTTLSVSAVFWATFVYVLQLARVSAGLQRVGTWARRALGVVLVGLGVQLLFSRMPHALSSQT